MLLICCHKRNIPKQLSLLSDFNQFHSMSQWLLGETETTYIASYWQQKSSWKPLLILEETLSKNSSSSPDLGKRGRKFLHFSKVAILSDLPLNAKIILRFPPCYICHLVTLGTLHRKDKWFKIQLTIASSLVIIILPALAPFYLCMTTTHIHVIDETQMSPLLKSSFCQLLLPHRLFAVVCVLVIITVVVCCLAANSFVTLVILWTVVYQAPPSTGISQREVWSGSPSPSPEGLADPRIKFPSPVLAGRFFATEPPKKPNNNDH